MANSGTQENNYYAYNIIDSIYYDSPNDLSIYGENLTRSLEDENDHLKFIQAVINRYVTNGNSYIDKYNNVNNGPAYAYFYNPDYSYLEVPHMLSNVNGVHNYKIMSAKDIDFDNICLPNSEIPDQGNWGTFDINRRWGTKKIYINNTFELLNVIDYLLCACNDLWAEINKLKYTDNETVKLWFVEDSNNQLMILDSKQITSNDFRKDSYLLGNLKKLTFLNPIYYSTEINATEFGIGTNFHSTSSDENADLILRRVLNSVASKNNFQAFIKEEANSNKFRSSTTQTYGGEIITIYGYKINGDLRLYPGCRIDNFINLNSRITDENIFVDQTNKKLKYDVFYKLNVDDYKQVYIQFLLNYSKQNQNKEHPYILYYIGNDNKKHIISCYTSNIASENNKTAINVNNITELINNIIAKDNNFINDIPGLQTINDETIVISNEEEINGNIETIYYPVYYIISDEYSINFEVCTPTTTIYNLSRFNITIYYYKQENTLKGNIFTLKDETINDDTKFNENNRNYIVPNIDESQLSSLSYNYLRYNIPSKKDVYFKFNSTYIALNNDNNTSNSDLVKNPLGLKLDDEYTDIMLFNYNEKLNDYINYYYLEDMKVDSNNNIPNNQRIFHRFESAGEFNEFCINHKLVDLKNNEFVHVWVKTNNPYNLTYTFENNKLVIQDYNNIDTEVTNINNEVEKISYNMLQLNHTLDEEIESIKVDLKLNIAETSKVKSVSYTMPINISKIYEPTINFIGKKITALENNKNSSKQLLQYADKNDPNNKETKTLTEEYNNRTKAIYGTNYTAYTDILDIIGVSNQTLESLSTNSLTYDNTNNNNGNIEFIYDCNNHYVNLFGSYFTKYTLNSNKNEYSPVLINNLNYKDSAYFFNINNFGRNYRLHTPDNIVVVGGNPTINEQFDLLSMSLQNSNNSIGYFMNFKFDDHNGNDEYQLSYIAYSKPENSNELEYLKNDYITFRNGFYDENLKNYTIKTVPFNICKTQYEFKMVPGSTIINNSGQNINNLQHISYYVPICYLDINTTTFCPPASTRPEFDEEGNAEYNLNDINDIQKYKNYVECWSDDSNNRPITLSIKLLENTDKNPPYFYESNEAKLKFNINRNIINTKYLTVSGKVETIYVALNSRYYLSDFIKMDGFKLLDQNNNNNNNNQQLINDEYPTGSYLSYNSNTHMFDVIEIYGNYGGDNNNYQNNISNHDAHYQSITDISNISGNNVSVFIPYPIQKKYNENSQVIYNYDIYRIADINKIKDISIASSNTNIDDIYIEYSPLTYIQIGENFHNNFQSSLNLINFGLSISTFYGSKKYVCTSSTTLGPSINISPIYRQKVENDGINLYKSLIINDNEYEFFEYKEDDIYHIKKNENDKYMIEPLYSTDEDITETDFRKLYHDQLDIFLNQNNTSYLCNISYIHLNPEWEDYDPDNSDNENNLSQIYNINE